MRRATRSERQNRQFHGFCIRPRQGAGVLASADPDEKAALRRSGNHVAVQHETQPAEHPHLSQRAGPGENRPYALCEIFIQSHRRDLPH
jgi:hypothetical protein